MIKKLLLLLFLYQITYSQVGIGTTNPTKDLDINGELRVRNLPTQVSTAILTTDSNGNIGVNNTPLLSEVNAIIADSNIDRTVNTFETIDNINLDLSLLVSIPANQNAIIIITYSVTVGMASFSTS